MEFNCELFLIKKKILNKDLNSKESELIHMMPITMAGIGEKCKIQKIGGNEETRRFLANLGFVNEAEVSIVSAIGGNVIVNIKDARVAVNSDMAKHIFI